MTKPTSDPTNSRSLLLVGDVPERLQRLESMLGISEIAMTRARSVEELAESCHHAHDLAIIDVEPQRLPEVLRTLRESSGHADIPLLVDRSRMAHDSTLAGVLPTYRAMPCSFDEVVQLARRRLNAPASYHAAESRTLRSMF